MYIYIFCKSNFQYFKIYFIFTIKNYFCCILLLLLLFINYLIVIIRREYNNIFLFILFTIICILLKIFTKMVYYKQYNNYYQKSKSTYVYSLNLKNGKKYVGLTQNLKKRMNDHFNGCGSKWTQKNKPMSINHIQKCKSYENAKKAEKIVYYNMKNYHGPTKVRGAGNTKSY